MADRQEKTTKSLGFQIKVERDRKSVRGRVHVTITPPTTHEWYPWWYRTGRHQIILAFEKSPVK
jgi:hypothetical protein